MIRKLCLHSHVCTVASQPERTGVKTCWCMDPVVFSKASTILRSFCCSDTGDEAPWWHLIRKQNSDNCFHEPGLMSDASNPERSAWSFFWVIFQTACLENAGVPGVGRRGEWMTPIPLCFQALVTAGYCVCSLFFVCLILKVELAVQSLITAVPTLR